MRISSVHVNNSTGEKEGIKNFSFTSLGNVVLLTGSNGSGKSRVLKMICNTVNDLRSGHYSDDIILKISEKTDFSDEVELDENNVDKIIIANYSHYDANLQSYRKFSPYVIHKAKDILQRYDYQETALNSLLFICDLINGYSPEFRDKKKFNEFCVFLKENFDIILSEENNQIHFFGNDPEKAKLSPGQQYLLRIAVACYQNSPDDKLIFFLDEPELHLHPRALLKTFEIMRKTFKHSQFWIATHSPALISHVTFNQENPTIFYFEDGEPSQFRSNSEKLLEGLIGNDNNLTALRSLIATPGQYASCKFATECYKEPDVKTAVSEDPQNNMLIQILKPNDVVVDYGVGKGRFFEGLGMDRKDLAQKITYYGYDKFNDHEKRCKEVMNTYGSTEKNYYSGEQITDLINRVKGQANYVILVNVLHEIPPYEWETVFENIYNLLAENGKLVIVEHEELKIGESPYDGNFLMITENAAKTMFGKENVKTSRLDKGPIARHEIFKCNLKINNEKIIKGIQQIQSDAYTNITTLKRKPEETEKTFKLGIKLTFWLHQYANASVILKDKFSITEKEGIQDVPN